MNPSAIFDLWQSMPLFKREQIRVACPAFNCLRRDLNLLTRALIEIETDDAARVALDFLEIRREMECRPASFDKNWMDRVNSLAGGRSSFRMRWGERLSSLHDDMVKSGEALLRSGNALSQVFASRTKQLRGKTSIWCHRTAIDLLCDTVGSEFHLMHSLPGYRESSIFDNLVVLGGLRKYGSGRVPEAVLLAPHFFHLVQVMWSSDWDDHDFGRSTLALNFDFSDFWVINARVVECGHANCDRVEQPIEIESDLQALELWAAARENKRRLVSNATLLTFGGGRALALRHGGRAMVFNATNGGVVEKDAHEVEAGDVLVTYEGEIDFGEPSEQHHELVRKWRNDLRCAHDRDSQRLLSSMRRNGISLKGLANCVDHWMSDRRPQRQADLERVCATLGWDKSSTRRLWKVFSEQHGDAIQTGATGREVEREEVERWIENTEIKEALAELPNSRTGQRSFEIRIAGDLLVLNAYVIDHADHHESIDESKIGKPMSLKEFKQ